MSSNTVYMELAENTTLRVPEEGDWLTVPEFAAQFRVEPQTIYAAIKAGEIKGVIRIGTRRGTRIPASSIESYRRSRLVASPAEVEDTTTRLMSALALHETARDTVRTALQDAYDAGRDSNNRPDGFCAHHGEDWTDTDPEPYCHGCVEAGVTTAPAGTENTR